MRGFGFGLAVGLGLLAIAYLAVCLNIGSGVRSASGMAMREFPGDRVSALMALVESEQHSLRDRNRAVWGAWSAWRLASLAITGTALYRRAVR